MKTSRMKLDYGNLLRYIDEVVSNDESGIAKEKAIGILTGLNLLTSYMRQIGERALELNDEVLIGLLVDLYILVEKKEDNTTEEKPTPVWQQQMLHTFLGGKEAQE